jgi:tubulin polyglutamylase TTLL6/13
MHALARKNQLGRNLTRMQRLFPKQYRFFPRTWLLPAESSNFRAVYSTKKSFIVKPEASCQGKGIFLVSRLDDIDPNERYVAQDYIRHPFLIEGLKFDFRIYVLVTSFDPLRVYIHESGLTRFATEPYEIPNRSNMYDMCMHLTNYAVNKRNPNFINDENSGHKRSLEWTFDFLQAQGYDVERLKKRINDLVIKTLCTVQPSIAHTYRSC